MRSNLSQAQRQGVNEAIKQSLENGYEITLTGNYLDQLLSYLKYPECPKMPYEITFGGSEDAPACTLRRSPGSLKK